MTLTEHDSNNQQSLEYVRCAQTGTRRAAGADVSHSIEPHGIGTRDICRDGWHEGERSLSTVRTADKRWLWAGVMPCVELTIPFRWSMLRGQAMGFA